MLHRFHIVVVVPESCEIPSKDIEAWQKIWGGVSACWPPPYTEYCSARVGLSGGNLEGRRASSPPAAPNQALDATRWKPTKWSQSPLTITITTCTFPSPNCIDITAIFAWKTQKYSQGQNGNRPSQRTDWLSGPPKKDTSLQSSVNALALVA